MQISKALLTKLESRGSLIIDIDSQQNNTFIGSGLSFPLTPTCLKQNIYYLFGCPKHINHYLCPLFYISLSSLVLKYFLFYFVIIYMVIVFLKLTVIVPFDFSRDANRLGRYSLSLCL